MAGTMTFEEKVQMYMDCPKIVIAKLLAEKDLIIEQNTGHMSICPKCGECTWINN